MENKTQIFEHTDFGKIRAVEINGQPWFVGKDVADILGYANSRKTLGNHVDDDDKLAYRFVTAGQNRSMTVINESGIYSLILSSKLPAAKKFKRWVTSEILPSVRKWGGYVTDNALDHLIDNPEAAMEFFNTLKEERAKKESLETKQEALEEYVGELKPKAEYYDIVLQCPDLIPVTIIAKDYGYSATAFNRLLFAHNFQFNQSGTWVLYQPYADNGYTQTKTYHVNGKARVHTYFTQKGRNFIYHLLKRKDILPLAERKAIRTVENEQMTLNE